MYHMCGQCATSRKVVLLQTKGFCKTILKGPYAAILEQRRKRKSAREPRKTFEIFEKYISFTITN